MKKLEVYDPPMCCSTGVCGPSVDENLVRFTADLDWLKSRGVTVARYNLSQQPAEFAKDGSIKDLLKTEGNECLPVLMIDGSVVHKGSYPPRDVLASLAGPEVSSNETLMSDAVRELVAVGAAIACNCEPCFKFHYDKARKLGVTKQDMLQAVQVARMVKDSPAKSIRDLAAKYLDEKPAAGEGARESGPGGGC